MGVIDLKTADFPKLLGNFLSIYLPSQRNFSKNTISSYCDTFKLLLKYFNSAKGISADKIQLKQMNRELFLDFISWLEIDRNCSISTTNQRLACIRSFFRFVQMEHPETMLECQKILGMPFRRKYSPSICYLNADDLKLILEQPNYSLRTGRRDLTLLSLLYDTGARVQEIADLKVRSIRLDAPAQVTLIGKGNKARVIPLMEATVSLLRGYLEEHHLNIPKCFEYPLFSNQRHEPLTRAGICYVLNKYANQARIIQPLLPEKITPHIFRHSKAMHLLEAGINIVYIRDILGHVDISTTEIYAKANMEMKRAALEKVSHISSGNVPFWANDADLVTWLTDFGKSLN